MEASLLEFTVSAARSRAKAPAPTDSLLRSSNDMPVPFSSAASKALRSASSSEAFCAFWKRSCHSWRLLASRSSALAT